MKFGATKVPNASSSAPGRILDAGAIRLGADMTYHFGPYSLRDKDLVLLEDGTPLPLGPKVVTTLLALVERHGQTVTKDEILARVWPEGFAEEGSLTQNVHVLRKVFRARLGRDVIETLPRRGYRITEPLVHAMQQSGVPVVRNRPGRVVIFAAIVAALLTMDAFARLSPTHESSSGLSAKAQEAYALARLHAESRKPAQVRQSIDEFRRVIDLAPSNPLGYSGLTESHVMQTFWCHGKANCDREADLAHAAARAAIRYGQESAEAHTAAAFVASALDSDEPRAESEFRTAIRLNPKYPAAHLWYGNLLLQRGKFDAAAGELEQAAFLEPRASMVVGLLGRAYLYSGRYRDAIAAVRSALQLDPKSTDALVTLGLAYDALGMYADAERSFRGLNDASEGLRQEVLRARELALLGRRSDAETVLRRARRRLASTQVSGVPLRDIAALEVSLGHKASAVAHLRDLRGAAKVYALSDPRLKTIRGGLFEGKIGAL